MSKNKKILYITLGSLDVAITLFLFAVSIIMLATMPETKYEIDTSTFIGYLQANPNVFLFVCVVPLFALLAINIVILYKYVKNSSKVERKPVGVKDLSDEEKEALRRELLKELAGESKKEDTPKEEDK